MSGETPVTSDDLSPAVTSAIDPQTVHVCNVAEMPSDVVLSLLSLHPDARPSVVCVDARGAGGIDDILAWRTMFERVVGTVNEPQSATGDRYCPRLAVICRPDTMDGLAQARKWDATLIAQAEPTDDPMSLELVDQYLYESIRGFYQCPPVETSEEADQSRARYEEARARMNPDRRAQHDALTAYVLEIQLEFGS